MKTIIEMAQEVCAEIGIGVFDALVANTDREAIEMRNFALKTCEEAARRVDWGQLQKTQSYTGTSAATKYDLPADFLRLQQGTAITYNGSPVRGGLTADEWNALPATVGAPRFFRMTGKKIEFWPALPSAQSVVVNYISKNWNTANKATWGADSETCLLPDEVVIKGMLWRWRRHKGMPYSDYMEEYEAALKDYASFDDRMRSP